MEGDLPLTGLREGSFATASSVTLPADLELLSLPSGSPSDESSASNSPAAQPVTPVKDDLKTADAPCKELQQSTICIPGAWGEWFSSPFLSRTLPRPCAQGSRILKLSFPCPCSRGSLPPGPFRCPRHIYCITIIS